MLDPKVVDNIGELTAGQSITASGFVGTLWIIAESGTQTWGLPFLQRGDARVEFDKT